MRDFRDYYTILGVSPTAAAADLKTAYRRAARRYHPDLNPGDPSAEDMFKQVGEAYEILSDSDRRSEYDSLVQFLNKGSSRFNPLKKPKDYSQFKDFNVFVDYLLNRRGASNSAAPTPSPSTAATPTPSPRPSTPPSASPSGRPSSTPPPAPRPGSRTVSRAEARASSRSPQPSPAPNPTRPGTATLRSTTRSNTSSARRSAASSSGTSSSGAASSTSTSTAATSAPTPAASTTPRSSTPTEAQLMIPLGKAYQGGRHRIRLGDGRTLTVSLPPGMVSGQTINVTADEPSGDRLSLLIQVLPHDFFTLKLPDVECQLPITPAEAVLGGPISVPTLGGPVKLTVPAGAHSGQKLRLTGKGYPVAGKPGDQIVELQVKIPPTITARERELYERLLRIESFRPRRDILGK